MSTPNNPFEMIERMFDQMSRQFEDAAQVWGTEGADMATKGVRRMGVDLADHGDVFEVTADVPGFEKDEIDLRITDTALHINATHERATEEQQETYLRSEREHRSLTERVRLPDPVIENEIEAYLQNGVLTVWLPKAEPMGESGRQIYIE